MAELLGVQYGQIALSAAIPAIAYFTSVFLLVGFLARGNAWRNIGTEVSAEDLTFKVNPILPRLYLLIPALVLVFMVLTGKSLRSSAITATVIILALNIVNKNRLNLKIRRILSCCAGWLAGTAVSLSGNMHYVIYAKILPLFGETDYWFPNSTRFIGHDPETLDQTIHEFPAYSFIQGDLHAHVVNIYFVLTVLGLLYAWLKQENKEKKNDLVGGFYDDYMDFDVPWNISISYNFTYSRPSPYRSPTISQIVNFSGDLSLTPKWKINFQSGYDIKNKEVTSTSFGVTRDLHCWEMTFNCMPFGQHQSYNFEIHVRSSLLRDLKLTKRDSWYDRRL